jgi:molecular chaperone DnaK (HSP70)
MAGRLGVDFGTSNTVLALWDDVAGQASAVRRTGYGRSFGRGDDRVPVVPSLIHYTADGRHFLGEQVLARNLDQNARTVVRAHERNSGRRNTRSGTTARGRPA